MRQCRLGEEIKRLDKTVEYKTKQMNEITFTSKGVEELKRHYEEQINILQSKKRKLEKECEELNKKLENLQTQSEEEQRTLKQKYLKQLEEKEKLLEYLKKKEEELEVLSGLLREADETRTKLEKEIEQKTAEKAQLITKIEENKRRYTDEMDKQDQKVEYLQEEIKKHLNLLERRDRIHNMRENELRRKVQEGEKARNRLREINQNPGTPPLTTKGTSSETTKSAKEDPVEPVDKSHQEWLERELDTCNQGIIFKTILDSETEQRRHAARLQRETEGRLKAIDRCISKDPSCADHYSNLIETLRERKEEYLEQVEKHSEQTDEVQTKCEKTRGMEGKQAPNFESKRWTSKCRSHTQTKELFKALFMIASDLKVKSYQYYAEKARLEQECAEVEVKLEDSEFQVTDLTAKLERARGALIRTAIFAPKATMPDISNAHVVDLIERMKHKAYSHNERAMSEVSSVHGDEFIPDLGLDSEDSSDGALEYSSDSRINQDSQTHTPEEEAEVLHCLNVRLATRGKPLAQELTIPLMMEELMMEDPERERENKTRNALIWDIIDTFMPQTAVYRRVQNRFGSASLAGETSISHNTSRQTKETQRRYEDTMYVEDDDEEEEDEEEEDD